MTRPTLKKNLDTPVDSEKELKERKEGGEDRVLSLVVVTDRR